MNDRLFHCTEIECCSREQLLRLIDPAMEISADPQFHNGKRQGRMLVNLFYEASTRTRVSSETAAKRLGMHVINISATGSSVEKGESLTDTFYAIQAMEPDCVVARHPEEGNATWLASVAEPGVHVINAGDGTGSHPSQALLLTLTGPVA